MSEPLDIVLDTALNLLERGVTGEIELIAGWIADSLVHELDEYRSGESSVCQVAGYEVCRIGDQLIVAIRDPQVMSSEQARMLATALLRAAEAADDAIDSLP